MNPVRISFGMIVLNGEPFLRYNLEALYPFAHQIIVVEGACATARSQATPAGHSRDRTLQLLREFQRRHDPDNKLFIVSAEDCGHHDGFWSEKDEMSQAYAHRATGNYLWQVDVDEFYRTEDMRAVVQMLEHDRTITAVSFRVRTFWGGLNYRTDGIALRRGAQDFHRLFAWGNGYEYVSHRPPTVLDDQGFDLSTLHHVSAGTMARSGVFLYHYAYLFPFQVQAKVAYYSPLDLSLVARREAWARNYDVLRDPFFIDDTSILGRPSWLLRYDGAHPQAITRLWEAVRRGDERVEQRRTDDIERVLTKPSYRLATASLSLGCRLLKVSGITQKVRPLRDWLRRMRGMPHRIAPTVRLMRRDHDWSLRELVVSRTDECEQARNAQFREWHGNDLAQRTQHCGAHPCQTPDFYRQHTAESALPALTAAVRALPSNGSLLVYAPHEFAFTSDQFRWIPRWRDLWNWAQTLGDVRVVDFNPGFDRNGFFHFIVQRCSQRSAPRSVHSLDTAHYFYLKTGGSLTLGRSPEVLSALGWRALRQNGRTIVEHHYLNSVAVGRGQLGMGHYGPWVTQARRNGALTILFGPGDRFCKYRGERFYAPMQSRGTFHAQYAAAHMAIMQASGLWRTVDAWTYPGLCRWIDLPVVPAVFPRSKQALAKPGQRAFCFINLYDEQHKGFDIAHEICRRCPELKFIAIGCRSFGLPNVREHPRMDNRSLRFRQAVTQADFVVAPSREDAQPGAVVEAGSLGLLPIVSSTAGYVLSFPQRLDLEDLDQCVQTLRAANGASEQETRSWQALFADYLERFHRPEACESLLVTYLNEAAAEL